MSARQPSVLSCSKERPVFYEYAGEQLYKIRRFWRRELLRGVLDCHFASLSGLSGLGRSSPATRPKRSDPRQLPETIVPLPPLKTLLGKVVEVRRRLRGDKYPLEKADSSSGRRTAHVKLPDHNAVQHDFLLHLLLFISRSSVTLRSMICPGRCMRSFGHLCVALVRPYRCQTIGLKLLPCLPGSPGAPLICQGTRYVATNGFYPSIVSFHRHWYRGACR